jgi:hypothetical protein
VGDNSHVDFGQTFLGEKEVLRWCIVMMQTAGSFVAKVWGKVFAHFNAFTVKHTVVCGTCWLTYQDEFFVNNPIDVKENDEHVLDFDLTLPWTKHAIQTFVYGSCFLPWKLV